MFSSPSRLSPPPPPPGRLRPGGIVPQTRKPHGAAHKIARHRGGARSPLGPWRSPLRLLFQLPRNASALGPRGREHLHPV